VCEELDLVLFLELKGGSIENVKGTPHTHSEIQPNLFYASECCDSVVYKLSGLCVKE
jgi:hypothetical protein